MCNKKSGTKYYLVSECEKFAQKEYKKRHDNVARIVHLELCGKYNLKRSEKCYEDAAEGVVENKEVKIKIRKPDIVAVNKSEKSSAIIDIVITGEIGVSEK